MGFVHAVIGFIKTVILIVLGAGIGFVLGAVSSPYGQLMGFNGVLQSLFNADSFAGLFQQNILVSAIVGAVIGGLIGWLIAWLTRRKPKAHPPTT